jgi:inosine/xanthosine triphosphatase
MAWPLLRIKGVKTESGVSEQPVGLEETIQGAKNRASSAWKTVEEASIGVGLESGLVVVNGSTFDFCACVIFDGSSQRHFTGVSPMFPLPPRAVATLAEKGYNQSFIDLGVEADPTGKGVLGQMPDGILSRPLQMKASVQYALMQLKNEALFSSAVL